MNNLWELNLQKLQKVEAVVYLDTNMKIPYTLAKVTIFQLEVMLELTMEQLLQHLLMTCFGVQGDDKK